MAKLPSTAEYGTELFNANQATVTLLESAYSTKLRSEVSLIHSTAGYELAGSCARLVATEYWAVRWHALGAIQGRRYRTQAEAERDFKAAIRS